MQYIKVLIADDHEMIREGLRKILEFEKDIVVVGEAQNGREAVEMACQYYPDVILMDINMPVTNGIEATRELLSARPDFNIVILTVYDDDAYVLEAIKAGAVGYLMKDVNSEALLSNIRKVAGGSSLIDSGVATRLLRDMVAKKAPADDPHNTLTDREVEVLKSIASGKSNCEIADHLSISERTVKNHITSIFKKINVHDRTQAAIFAIREGFATL